MSLKFLAVGQSLAGIRGDKSPYAWRKENQLPTFESAPRFKHPEKMMVQTDWIQPAKPVTPAPMVALDQAYQPQIPAPSGSVAALPAKRRWFSFFGLKWFRTNKPRVDLVQSELSLEKVQPIRNDLADSDLRLVLKRRAKNNSIGPERTNSRGRAGWSELTAKLFELGQK
jgi:hypothetical protein